MGQLLEAHKDKNIVILRLTYLTAIGIYIPPHFSAEDTVEIIMDTLTKVKNDSNVILAGDLNCRIDKPLYKTELILELFKEEGFSLVNKM